MTFLFYVFSSLALISAALVIFVTNPVHSVLFLILVFFNTAGLLLLLGLEFFAMTFLVVYIGAIAVLFLFVVMMLNIKLASINEKRYRYFPIGGVLGLIFLFEVFCIIGNDLIVSPKGGVWVSGMLQSDLCLTDWAQITATLNNVEALGECVYTFYCWFFLCAGLILLIAMVGAIVLTHHQQTALKTQQIILQNARDFNKTVKKLN